MQLTHIGTALGLRYLREVIAHTQPVNMHVGFKLKVMHDTLLFSNFNINTYFLTVNRCTFYFPS